MVSQTLLVLHVPQILWIYNSDFVVPTTVFFMLFNLCFVNHFRFHCVWDKLVWLIISLLHFVHRGRSFEMSMISWWAECLLTQHLYSMPSGVFVISIGLIVEKIRTDWFVIQRWLINLWIIDILLNHVLLTYTSLQQCV